MPCASGLTWAVSKVASEVSVKTLATRSRRVWMGMLGLAGCLALATVSVAVAQDATASALGDRAQIQDLITRYYYNFGRSKPESFSDFYADSAELILGNTHYKGKAGIAKAYGGGGGPSRNAYS